MSDMNGTKQILHYNGDFPSFLEVVKKLPHIGGSLLWKDGKGIFVEPDLTKELAVDISTLKLLKE